MPISESKRYTPAMVAQGQNVLFKMLAPVLTPETAERLVSLRIDAETRVRIDELADKANEGTLTDPERVEYAEYVEAMDLIGLLQAEARGMLDRRVAP